MRHMPRPMLFGGEVSPVFIGSAGGVPAGTGARSIPYPAGTVAGDLAIVVVSSGGFNQTVSTAGWTLVGLNIGTATSVYLKVLTTADLTATANIASSTSISTLATFVFRGFSAASSLTVQGVASNDAAGSHSWTGVTKGASCRALIFLMSGDFSSTPTITSPSMASLAYTSLVVGGSHDFRLGYVFTPAQYTNTTSIGENHGSGWNQLDFAVLELI